MPRIGELIAEDQMGFSQAWPDEPEPQSEPDEVPTVEVETTTKSGEPGRFVIMVEQNGETSLASPHIMGQDEAHRGAEHMERTEDGRFYPRALQKA